MKERPILMSGPMVTAILRGRKTQTRRVAKDPAGPCPYGVPGDFLWVREATEQGSAGLSRYRATGEVVYDREIAMPAQWFGKTRFKPPMHMPRRWCRLRLHVTKIRVEPLQSISEQDAIAEGSRYFNHGEGRDGFESLWESINGKKYPWASNPWVWVVEFERML